MRTIVSILQQPGIEDKLDGSLIREVIAAVRAAASHLGRVDGRLSGSNPVAILVVRETQTSLFRKICDWQNIALYKCDWDILRRMDGSLINAVEIRRTFHVSFFWHGSRVSCPRDLLLLLLKNWLAYVVSIRLVSAFI